MVNVEVAYATLQSQTIIPVSVPHHATVREVINVSRIIEIFPEINLETQKVGIFSVIVNLDHEVKEGDRVEIYRPLQIDPITRRFQRVAIGRKKSCN